MHSYTGLRPMVFAEGEADTYTLTRKSIIFKIFIFFCFAAWKWRHTQKNLIFQMCLLNATDNIQVKNMTVQKKKSVIDKGSPLYQYFVDPSFALSLP